ncbi:tetratricopeptide repeat protein [Polynucleobacter sp. UK-Mo-2m-Kol15]|uniref:tetratricopeptide repeat-containing glycosyltransferase family protein n=1 Tax=Polynucleobacter sp. UK-Mo-2m-Kol15 TaxID=2576916 RepID=UPI001C0CC7BD|nr:tetratricopeptide repeat protein [Polynucleobacter sp. UK-Mo-2m-Kol15]MBU3574578.1 tetratricopeptide repeat protein [Polynucleobacter sp. UK-Mo-2m-Kol15]
MSNQLNFLLNQALLYIQSSNFSSAKLLLKQIIKVRPNHSEALRLSAVISAQEGHNNLALEMIEKAILADKRNGIAYSNRGNIQLSLGMLSEAIASYEVAIKQSPSYAEVYSNLGNAYQELGENTKAIDLYKRAISIDSNNPEVFCNLGNAYWKLDMLGDARKSYGRSIELAPSHVNSLHNLAHLDLREFNFSEGWDRHEARWFITEQDRPIAINSSRPRWDGLPRDGRLFIWAEQGIGDQILYASMLKNLDQYPQTKIVSVDKKLIPIFQRSFPSIKIVDKDIDLPEEDYDEQIPMGSLGQILRSSIESFKSAKFPYLLPKLPQTDGLNLNKPSEGNIQCGLSWKSGRAKLGVNKSIPILSLAPLLSLKGINFVNLQYGNVGDEVDLARNDLGAHIQIIEDINLYDDIDGLIYILDACNIVLTTSNSTAHFAGALGKETLLLLPCGNSRFWYWHDIDGISLWYPSIRVFKQERYGDWSKPIGELKTYLESRFAI